jgi:hypothetical protein
MAISAGKILAQSSSDVTPDDYPGTYDALKPEQKALVNDWMKRLSGTRRKTEDPETTYNNLPLSLRTTFMAVTHALISTTLTDAADRNLGSAIQLVKSVDSVQGAVPGARGDEQFRMYVKLRLGARELLDKTQEFQRIGDNTVYHAGYPICYRSLPSLPSIQVSATQDMTRADLDIDYRSSSFFKALLDGHLTADNSDVRAGQNFQTHVNRWQGLNDWWRSPFSVERISDTDARQVQQILPPDPRRAARDTAAEAVHDLLNTWLVEKKPEQVLSYFAPDSFYCVDLEHGEKVDHGMAKFKLLVAMQQANRLLGSPAQLADVSRAAGLGSATLRTKLVKQPYDRQFALYDVREDAAEQFNCANRVDRSRVSPKAAASKEFGKYYGAIFRLGGNEGSGGTTLATLWSRQSKKWRLISYDIDPVWGKYRATNNSVGRPPTAPAQFAWAPPEVVAAATKFLETWFVNRDVEHASAYVSSKCASCLKLGPYANEQPPAGDTQTQLKQAMRRVSVRSGSVLRLDRAIVAPQPSHEDLKIVKHANQHAFVLVAIPDYMASALDCSSRVSGQPVRYIGASGGKTYGDYYATGLRLAKAGEDSGVLWAVWAREGGTWKVVSYTVLTP